MTHYLLCHHSAVGITSPITAVPIIGRCGDASIDVYWVERSTQFVALPVNITRCHTQCIVHVSIVLGVSDTVSIHTHTHTHTHFAAIGGTSWM